MRSRAALFVLLVAIGTSREAPALADAAEDIQFVYDAPAGCPSEEQFVEAVFRNGGAFARAPDGALARTFQVRIVQSDIVTGHLVVRDRTGHEAERTIAGARCEDVARSLAVLAALALEPATHADGTAPATDADGTNPATDADAEPAPATPAVPPPSSTPPPAAPAKVASPQTASASGPGEPPSALEPLPPGWRLGTSAEGTLSGLGSVAPGVAAYVELVRDVRQGFDPALRVGVELAGASVAVPSADAGLATTTSVALTRRVARLDACPLRDVMARPWSPSPLEAWACARLDAGVLDVSSDLSETVHAQRPWAAAGALVHLRGVARRFFVDVEGGVVFPLLRERFLESATTVYQVPVVTGSGGLALGVYFL